MTPLRAHGRLQGVDTSYVTASQYPFLQERSHKQRPLQSLAGEIRCLQVDIVGSVKGQIFAHNENQIEVGSAERAPARTKKKGNRLAAARA